MSDHGHNEVTRILTAIQRGEPQASDALLPVVYRELRNLAASQLRKRSFSDTFQATELVHEAYLRLVDDRQSPSWDNRGHFFAAAAEAMRRILVERARRKSRIKHGGELQRVGLSDVAADEAVAQVDLLALDEALERLAAEFPKHAELVKLRYFAGLKIEDAGRVMGVSRATAARYWTFARAWLLDAVEGDRRDPDGASPV